MNETSRLSVWMRFGQPLEPVLENYQQMFDGWQAGGVTTIVVGRLFFTSSEGKPMAVPAFTPNPAAYQAFGVEPPAPPAEELPEKRKQLLAALAEAKNRGLSIFVFCPEAGAGPGGKGHHMADPSSLAAAAARMRDVSEQFPMVDGLVLDGPELGYELDPNHRSYIFNDLPENLRPKAGELGYDFDRLTWSRDRLFKRLHSLRPADIDLHADGGMLGAFELFGSDPGLMKWLAFRRDLLVDYHHRLKKALDSFPRKVLIAEGSRSACFAPLNGYDLIEMGKLFDFLLPKHYFFHRGFDGLYGTVGRTIRILTEWNPGLMDAHAMKVVEALFGLHMPWIRSRFDLDLGFPSEFFETVVKTETRRALAAVDDPARIVPWVESGREPHDGDPISSGDLYRILIAARDAGLRQFLYHNHRHLTEAEWVVISRLCGRPWMDGQPGYAPPDSLAWESVSRRGYEK